MVKAVQVVEKEYRKVTKALGTIEKDKIVVFFKKAGRALVTDFRLGLKRGVSPDDTPFAPITHRTGQPLIDTGRLRASITSIISNETLEVGTNVDYAKHQQFGGKGTFKVAAHTRLINQAFGKKLKSPVYVNVKAHIKKAAIKARPFLGVEARQKKRIIQVYEKHIKDVTGGAVQ